MKQVRARLTVLMICVALVTFFLSIFICELFWYGAFAEQNTVNPFMFGYVVRDFLLMLLAAALLLVMISIMPRRMSTWRCICAAASANASTTMPSCRKTSI